MQFTSNIIVALLLVVSGSTVTAAQELSNLRGGRELHEGTEPSGSKPSPPEFANVAFPNHERSLLDGCKGLDSKVDFDICGAHGSNVAACPACDICCKSLYPSNYYCMKAIP